MQAPKDGHGWLTEWHNMHTRRTNGRYLGACRVAYILVSFFSIAFYPIDRLTFAQRDC
jgi:hypothetical protein